MGYRDQFGAEGIYVGRCEMNQKEGEQSTSLENNHK